MAETAVVAHNSAQNGAWVWVGIPGFFIACGHSAG